MNLSYKLPVKNTWNNFHIYYITMEVEILLEVFRMRNKYVAAAALSLLMMNPFNAGAAGKNGVAAVVNGEKITVAEMKQGYEDNRQIKEKVSFDDFYEKALEIYVNGKLLYQPLPPTSLRLRNTSAPSIRPRKKSPVKFILNRKSTRK